VEVAVTDRAGNVGGQSFAVVNDTVSPAATITVPSVAGLRFAVTWAGSDAEAGVRSYEVEFKDGAGAWTEWLTETVHAEAYFRGEMEHTYTFRVRATDNVNNPGEWVESGPVEIATVTKYYTFNGQRVAMRRGAEVYFIHGDHLGSTSLTTSSNDNKVAEVRYLPYGQERWSAEAGVTDFGFTGQRSEGFNLLDYNARYYSPYLGRFISPDTIVPSFLKPQSLNRYSYVLNNPLRYIDPTGHQEEPEPLWVEVLRCAVEQTLKYREDIFFPDENTTSLERLEASYVVGVLSVAVAWATVEGVIGGPFFDPEKWDTREEPVGG
jgi:RHS repeat-associated protein